MRSYKFAAIDMTNHSYTLEQVCDLHGAEQGYLYIKGEPQPDWMGDKFDWPVILKFMKLAFAVKMDIHFANCNIYVFDENAQETFWALKHLASEVQARHFKASNKTMPIRADLISTLNLEMFESLSVSTHLRHALKSIEERINEWLTNEPTAPPDHWFWERGTLTQILAPYLVKEQNLIKQYFKLRFSKW